MLCKRKTSVRKQLLRCRFWFETGCGRRRRKTPTARTMSHKNLLTSLKFYNFSFYFLLLFFMMIPDDWRNNIPCILSRFLNFLVEECFSFHCHCRHYPNLCVNMFCWRQKPRRKKKDKISPQDREKKVLRVSLFKEKLYYYATHFRDMGFVTLRF